MNNQTNGENNIRNKHISDEMGKLKIETAVIYVRKYVFWLQDIALKLFLFLEYSRFSKKRDRSRRKVRRRQLRKKYLVCVRQRGKFEIYHKKMH